MTKKFEEIITGRISDVAQKIAPKKLKGEIVIVLYGDNKKDQEINLEKLSAHLKENIALQNS